MEETERSGFELVLGSRQIAALLFVFAALIASTAGLAYLAGRTVAPVQAAAPAKPEPVKELKPQTTAQAEPAPPKAAATAQEVRRITPQSGELYVQAGVVARGMAEVMAEYLSRKGFAASVMEGTSETNLRVLVGPVSSTGDGASIRQGLEQAGFSSFLRRY